GELDHKPSLQKADYIKGGQDGVGAAVSKLTDTEKREYILNYYAMVEMVDEYIGKLIDFLMETGQYEDTIIIFHTDHGEMLCDNVLILNCSYFYEELSHITFIILTTNLFKKDCTSNDLVELVDISLALLYILGMDIPYYMQGQSLLPILSGEADPDYHKDSVY